MQLNQRPGDESQCDIGTQEVTIPPLYPEGSCPVIRVLGTISSKGRGRVSLTQSPITSARILRPEALHHSLKSPCLSTLMAMGRAWNTSFMLACPCTDGLPCAQCPARFWGQMVQTSHNRKAPSVPTCSRSAEHMEGGGGLGAWKRAFSTRP